MSPILPTRSSVLADRTAHSLLGCWHVRSSFCR